MSDHEDSFEVEKKMKSTIHLGGKIKFTDVFGLDGVIKDLTQSISLPIYHKYLFADRNPMQSFLFYGPPGTGKTMIAQAVAAEMKEVTFFSISASNIISKYQGESEQNIKVLFNLARKAKPSIIFFDEIDAIGLSRSDEESDFTRRIKTELLVQLNGFDDNLGVFVMAATNTPQKLDPALLRRFDKLIYINLPNKDARYKMLVHRLSSEAIKEIDLELIAAKTNGFSGSEIDKLCRAAKLQPITRLQNTNYFRMKIINNQILYEPTVSTDPEAIKIDINKLQNVTFNFKPAANINDVLNVLKQIKPRTTNELLRQLDKFNADSQYIRRDYENKEETSFCTQLFCFLDSLLF